MIPSYNWNTELLREIDAEAALSIVDFACFSDSTGGAQDNDLYYGSADFLADTYQARHGCAGAYMVRPWPRAGFVRGHPGDGCFDSQSFVSTCWRMFGRESAFSANYLDLDNAPTDDDGAVNPPGEVHASDLIGVFGETRPQGATAWSSNGMTGAGSCGYSSNSGVIRGAFVQFPNPAHFAYTTQRFKRYWGMRPTTAGLVRGFEAFDLYWARRNIPTPGGAGKYATGQLAFKVQQFNGTGSAISGDNAGSDTVNPAYWSDMAGGSLPTGTNYGLQKLALTPSSPTHGIGFHTSGAGYNQPSIARGIAVMGVSSRYDGVTKGVRIARFTRSGYQSNTLNDASFDGTATDPQRIIIEAMDPSVIVLTSAGANDVSAGVTRVTFGNNILNFILRVLSYRPNQRFIYMATYPGDVSGAAIAARGEYIDEVYERIVNINNRRICIVDQYNPGLNTPSSYYTSSHLATDDSGVPYFLEDFEQLINTRKKTIVALRSTPGLLRRGMLSRRL